MDTAIYMGSLGIFLGGVSLLVFAYRRIRHLLRKDPDRKALSPGLLRSLRNLTLIMLWTGIFGMVFFMGLFLRAFHVFTQEEPIARITTQPLPLSPNGPRSLISFTALPSHQTRYILLRGDQWMIEGDILKWNPWVRFLGFQTRYRLTRLRGRYLDIRQEREQTPSVHALSREENHSLWRYLYAFGQHLPLVDTVYGNASYQDIKTGQQYMVYVGDAGFVVRKVANKPPTSVAEERSEGAWLSSIQIPFDVLSKHGVFNGQGGFLCQVGEQGDIFFSKAVGPVLGVDIENPQHFRTAKQG